MSNDNYASPEEREFAISVHLLARSIWYTLEQFIDVNNEEALRNFVKILEMYVHSVRHEAQRPTRHALRQLRALERLISRNGLYDDAVNEQLVRLTARSDTRYLVYAIFERVYEAEERVRAQQPNDSSLRREAAHETLKATIRELSLTSKSNKNFRPPLLARDQFLQHLTSYYERFSTRPLRTQRGRFSSDFMSFLLIVNRGLWRKSHVEGGDIVHGWSPTETTSGWLPELGLAAEKNDDAARRTFSMQLKKLCPSVRRHFLG